MHINKGKSIRQCLYERTDYALNPDKTDDMKYVSSYACSPETVDEEFMLTKKEYFNITGRVNKNDIIAYQLRQSFKPGEVTPEEANAISYELASRLLKGQFAFIVATHADKKHIHSHIIFNSTALDCTHKYKNPIGSYRDIRRLADMVCAEHNLSVIHNPGPATPSFGTGDKAKKRVSNRDILKAAIDKILAAGNPKSFDDLLRQLENSGYEIKKGKYISVRGIADEKNIRLKSLGERYAEEYLKIRIAKSKPFKKENDRPSMLIDIQKAMSEGKGTGYQNWAKVFNLKQMAKAYAYLQENNMLTYENLSETVLGEKKKTDELQSQLNGYNKRLDEISELRKHIINYARNNEIYKEYKAKNFSKKYKEEHRKEIEEYVNAKHYFDSLNLDRKLPKVKDLNREFQETLKKKRETFNLLLPTQKEYRKHLIYKENVRLLLDINEKQKQVSKQRAGLGD